MQSNYTGNPLLQSAAPQQNQQQQNPMQYVAEVKNNPVSFLQQRGYQIPENIANDPNAIMNYLLQSGQVANNRLAPAQRMLMQLMGRRQ